MRCLLAAAMMIVLAGGMAVAAGGPHGLHVDKQGRLTKDGKPYRGLGVNYYDVFLRKLDNPANTDYETGFAQLAAAKIPFVRFIACGFWPKDARLYLDNRDEFFRRFDLIVQAAQKNGVGLIPSLCWNEATVCDLVGETCDQWGNPSSKTISYMRQYVKDVVTRYQDSPAIWGWEFGNEFNLGANLPNAAQWRPTIVPDRGTALSRSEKDEWTYEIIRTAFGEFAKEVRKYDPYRIISTGDSVVRPGAWHNWKEKSWTVDTLAQQLEMTVADNPDPVDVISVHIYEKAVEQLPMALQAAQQAHKPLFVGEFGVPGTREKSEQEFRTMLAAIEAAKVPLACLWTFGGTQKDTYTVGAEGDRAYQLEALTDANARIAAGR